jgi:hypothetical protein
VGKEDRRWRKQAFEAGKGKEMNSALYLWKGTLFC